MEKVGGKEGGVGSVGGRELEQQFLISIRLEI